MTAFANSKFDGIKHQVFRYILNPGDSKYRDSQCNGYHELVMLYSQYYKTEVGKSERNRSLGNVVSMA